MLVFWIQDRRFLYPNDEDLSLGISSVGHVYLSASAFSSQINIPQLNGSTALENPKAAQREQNGEDRNKLINPFFAVAILCKVAGDRGERRGSIFGWG